MAYTPKKLGQAQGTTSPVSIYSPVGGIVGIVRQVVICNHEAAADEFGIWFDDDGTTYSDATVLFEDTEIAAKSTVILDVFWPMANSAGNLAVKAKTASTLTFTVLGAEIS